MLKTYLSLAKPERTLANVLTAAAGFLLASRGHVRFWLLLETLLGVALVIASACVVNNLSDQTIDKQMKRTRKRALVSGEVSTRSAIIYASALGSLGFLVLAYYVSLLVVMLGAIAYIDYVLLYGLAKRRTIHSTITGSVAGGLSIVAGYCAASGRFNSAALILFLILAVWQMPHFYAIGLFRLKDYRAANLPILPVVKDEAATKRQIVVYIILFLAACLALSVFGYSGLVYSCVMAILSLWWLALSLQGFKLSGVKSDAWARQMFKRSLVILLVFCLVISLNHWLP